MAFSPFFEVGQIVSTQGLAGEVRVHPWCDDPALLTTFDEICVGGAGAPPSKIERARVQKNVAVLKIAGVDSVEDAMALRGKILYVPREWVPIAEGEYFIADLLGCGVFDADSGAPYGELCDVSHTGANDVWHIRFPDGTQKLIPVIPQVVRAVDVPARRVEITPLKGLFD